MGKDLSGHHNVARSCDSCWEQYPPLALAFSLLAHLTAGVGLGCLKFTEL